MSTNAVSSVFPWPLPASMFLFQVHTTPSFDDELEHISYNKLFSSQLNSPNSIYQSKQTKTMYLEFTTSVMRQALSLG